jgi:hypothetical protein
MFPYSFKPENGRLVKNEDEMKVISRIKGLRSRGYSWEEV